MNGDDEDIDRIRQLAAEHTAKQHAAEASARTAQTAAEETARRASSAIALAAKLAQQLRAKQVPMATFEIVKNKKVLWRFVSEHVVVMQGWTFATRSMRSTPSESFSGSPGQSREYATGFVLVTDGTIRSINIQYVTRMPGGSERYLVWTLGHSQNEITEQTAKALVEVVPKDRMTAEYVGRLESGLAELVARYELIL